MLKVTLLPPGLINLPNTEMLRTNTLQLTENKLFW